MNLIVAAGLMVTATCLAVVILRGLTVGSASAVIVSGAALLGLVLSALRRRHRPNQDCAALVACTASFAVAFSTLGGALAIAAAVEAVLAVVAATCLLVVTADAASNSTRSRFRR